MKSFVSFFLVAGLILAPIAPAMANQTAQEDALAKAEAAEKAAIIATEAALAAQQAAIAAQEAAQAAINAAVNAANVAGIESSLTQSVTTTTTTQKARPGISVTAVDRPTTLGAGLYDEALEGMVPSSRPGQLQELLRESASTTGSSTPMIDLAGTGKIPQSTMDSIIEALKERKGIQAGQITIIPSAVITIQSQMSDQIRGYGATEADNGSQNARFNQMRVGQRMQFAFEVLASENTSLFVVFRSPSDAIWGNDRMWAGDHHIAYKIAMVTYKNPDFGLNVRVGKQYQYLPRTMQSGSVLMGEYIPGIRVDQTLNDRFSYFAWWGRPLSGDDEDERVSAGTADTLGTGWNNQETYYDMFALGAAIKTPSLKTTFQPYAVYASAPKNFGATIFASYVYDPVIDPSQGHDASLWWFGLVGERKHSDKLTYGFNLLYGGASYDDYEYGYLVDAYFSYLTDKKTKFIAKAWYASGDGDEVDEKRNLITPKAAGSYGVFSNYFDYSLFGIITSGGIGSPSGTTGFAIGFTDFRPFEGEYSNRLTFGASMNYIHGTNSTKNPTPNTILYQTTSDSILELGVHTKYQFSKNITLGFLADLLIPTYDKYAYPNPAYHATNNPDVPLYLIDKYVRNGWRLGLGLQYRY